MSPNVSLDGFSGGRRIVVDARRMMRRAVRWLLAVLVLAACGWWFYLHTGSRAGSGSGDVSLHDTSSDSQDAKDDTPTKSGTASTSVQTAAATSDTIPASTPVPEPAAAPAKPAAGLPVSDSIPRDPPAGMAFGGSGKFQWYRQGDITWRIDTVSGATCIDFATLDEWAKPVVSSHGCRKS